MNSCLGIYLDDKVIKYAKLDYEPKNKVMQVNTCGVKQVVGDKIESIYNIIDETGSQSIPVALNLCNFKYRNLEMLKQLNKSDVQSLLDLEIFEVANEMEVNEKTLTYRYLDLGSESTMDNNNIVLAVCERSELEQYSKNEKIKISAVYPISFVLEGIVEKSDQTCMLVNIGENTETITITGGDVTSISSLGIGMDDILTKIAAYIGSVSKAYEMCKTINVFTDTANVNDPEVEKIIEPVLQDILHRVEDKIKTSKKEISKIYISGLGTLFTNIDMLFKEYLGISTAILKPYFINSEDRNSNISDIIEVNEAIALANEYLVTRVEGMNFLNDKQVKGNGKELKEKLPRIKFSLKDIKLDMNKISDLSKVSSIVVGSIIVIYCLFGIIYDYTTSSMGNKLTSATTDMKTQNLAAKEDLDYVKANTKKYSDINSFVSETMRKVEGNEIGKYSTYNVANFMQKIVKYIPKGVTVISISSDDNKKVTMTAESISYADLGYFVSQLKLKGILENVLVSKVEHSESITITIGGDLP